MSSNLLTVPLADECLYSTAAHHTQKWFKGTTPGAATLLQRKTSYARDLVGHLDELAQVFAPEARLTGEILALRHTVLPLHLPFLDLPTRKRLVERACSGTSLQLALGVAPSRLTSARALRLCPKCVYTDRQKFGRSYWHREHQLAGVLVCPLHDDTLLAATSVRPDWHFGQGKFIPPEEATAISQLAWMDEDRRKLSDIARDNRWLLDHEVNPPGVAQLQALYRDFAHRKGFRQSNGSVALARLRGAFEAHYGPTLLERIGCSVSGRGGSWVAALLRKPRAHQQPLRHILLARFFGLSIGEALTAAAATEAVIPVSRPHVHRIKRDARLSRLLPVKRELWIKALAAGTSSARERAPTLYCWLWRNDREWLRQHRGRNHIRQSNPAKWAARDQHLARRVQDIAIGLRSSDSSPRVSRNLIAIRSGRPAWLVRDHPLLPRTVDAIKAVSESPVQYALRRIAHHHQQHVLAGQPWRVRVACGISSALAKHPVVDEALRRAAVTPPSPIATETVREIPHAL